MVLARGLTDRLLTRTYLPTHPGLETDPLLSGLEPGPRETLLTGPGGHG